MLIPKMAVTMKHLSSVMMIPKKTIVRIKLIPKKIMERIKLVNKPSDSEAVNKPSEGTASDSESENSNFASENFQASKKKSPCKGTKEIKKFLEGRGKLLKLNHFGLFHHNKVKTIKNKVFNERKTLRIRLRKMRK